MISIFKTLIKQKIDAAFTQILWDCRLGEKTTTKLRKEIITYKREKHMVKRLALTPRSLIFDINQMSQHLLKLYQNPFGQFFFSHFKLFSHRLFKWSHKDRNKYGIVWKMTISHHCASNWTDSADLLANSRSHSWREAEKVCAHVNVYAVQPEDEQKISQYTQWIDTTK